MGLLDVIIGRRKLKAPATDRLFAITTAYVTFETELGIKSRRQAAIVFQALDTADFNNLVKDMEEVVRATCGENGGTVRSTDDSYGFRWMVLSDAELEDLAVGINAISGELETGGYAERLLCAVFGFVDDKDRPLYWIYNYKRGFFYPFVPAPGGAQERDTERELRLKAQAGPGLPIEPELERWFPLWGIPI